MKRIHRYDITLVDIFLNKQLEKYSTTIEELLLLPESKINGIPWYQYYTFNSDQEWLDWKNFCIDFLVNKVTPKFNKKEAEREFMWLDLNYGLKHNYE